MYPNLLHVTYDALLIPEKEFWNYIIISNILFIAGRGYKVMKMYIFGVKKCYSVPKRADNSVQTLHLYSNVNYFNA